MNEIVRKQPRIQPKQPDIIVEAESGRNFLKNKGIVKEIKPQKEDILISLNETSDLKLQSGNRIEIGKEEMKEIDKNYLDPDFEFTFEEFNNIDMRQRFKGIRSLETIQGEEYIEEKKQEFLPEQSLEKIDEIIKSEVENQVESHPNNFNESVEDFDQYLFEPTFDSESDQEPKKDSFLSDFDEFSFTEEIPPTTPDITIQQTDQTENV